jgi:hypothetical protein
MMLLIGCFFMGGCSKPAANTTNLAQPTPNTQTSTSDTAPPIYTPLTATPVIAANENGGADLKQLNHAYISWIVQNRRRAKNFEDFVAASGIQVPPAPQGQKYAIDKNGFIALVNQ